MKKRFLPLLLALVMVLSLLPATVATAEGDDETPAKNTVVTAGQGVEEFGYFSNGAKAEKYFKSAFGATVTDCGSDPIVYVRLESAPTQKEVYMIEFKVGSTTYAAQSGNGSTVPKQLIYWSLENQEQINWKNGDGWTWSDEGNDITETDSEPEKQVPEIIAVYQFAEDQNGMDPATAKVEAAKESGGKAKNLIKDQLAAAGEPDNPAESIKMPDGKNSFEIVAAGFKRTGEAADAAVNAGIDIVKGSGTSELKICGTDTDIFYVVFKGMSNAHFGLQVRKQAGDEKNLTSDPIVAKTLIGDDDLQPTLGGWFVASESAGHFEEDYDDGDLAEGTYYIVVAAKAEAWTGSEAAADVSTMLYHDESDAFTLKKVTFKVEHAFFNEEKTNADPVEVLIMSTESDPTVFAPEVYPANGYTDEGVDWVASENGAVYTLACTQAKTADPTVNGQMTVAVAAEDGNGSATVTVDADYTGFTFDTNNGIKVYAAATGDTLAAGVTGTVTTSSPSSHTIGLTFDPAIRAETTYYVSLIATETDAALLPSNRLAVTVTPFGQVAKLNDLAIAEFSGEITGDEYSGAGTLTKYYIVDAAKMNTVSITSWNKDTTENNVKDALGVTAPENAPATELTPPVLRTHNGSYLVVAVYTTTGGSGTLLAVGQLGPIEGINTVKQKNVSVSSSGSVTAAKQYAGNLWYVVVDGSKLATVDTWLAGRTDAKTLTAANVASALDVTVEDLSDHVPTLENGKNLVVVEMGLTGDATHVKAAGYAAINLGSASDEGGAPTPPSQTQQPTDPEPTTPVEPEIEEVPVEVEEVTATVDETTGTATAEVTEEAMDEAVDEAIAAIAEAEAEGEEVAPVVTIPVKVAEGAKNIEVKLPAKSVEKLAETKTAALEVKSDVGEVKLDNTALKALAEVVDETSTITLEVNTSEEAVALNTAQNEKVAEIVDELLAENTNAEEAGVEVIDVTLLVNDKPVHDFGSSASIEVTVPAPKNVNASNVRVYYMDDNGKLERMPGAKYENGKVKFKTNHLSKYIISAKALLPELPFTDVPADAWYMNELAWAYEKGIAKGMDDAGTLFMPGVGCTRAQFVTFLWRACGEPKVEAELKFTDVDPAQYSWAMDAIKWAVANKIIFGTDEAETIFEPETVCSRAQAMTMMYRADGQPDAGTFGKFTDVPEGEYYTNAVAWAVAMKITEGATDTTFEPASPCIRAQMVVFLCRMFNPAAVG